ENRFSGRDVSALLPSATTDAAGRFRLSGFDREQLVHLHIEGPRIETQRVYVVTRPGVRVHMPRRARDPLLGPEERVTGLRHGFDLPAGPGQVVAGTGRAAATRQPIPPAAP